jgi:putative oxidoreductase
MSSSPTWLDKAHEASRPLDGLGLLALRVWAAQEFMQAGWHKLSGGLSAPGWFAGLDFPFPLHLLPVNMNWVAAGLGEVVLGGALLLGLFSRLSALGLLFITWVAVYTVHFDLGWAGWNQIDTENGQGFKVPLMLAIMLLAIATQGGGQWSLDAWRGRGRRHLPPASGS